MRFGIMAMQIDYLIPPSNPGESPEAVLAKIAGFDLPDVVKHLAEEGFNPIELGGDLAVLLPHTFSTDSISRLAALKEELGVSYTLHLPLWSVEPSTMLEPVRKGSVQALIENMRIITPLEPEVYVLHATGELAAEFYHLMNLPRVARDFMMRQFQNGARQSIQELLEGTGVPPRKLAIETVAFPFDLTLELAEEFDISICLDTGHVLAGFSGPIGIFDALERCLPRLGEIHLHDCLQPSEDHEIGFGKDHRPLGEGGLDVGGILDVLQQAEYQGPIIFELRLSEALQSMRLIRELRPQLVQ